MAQQSSGFEIKRGNFHIKERSMQNDQVVARLQKQDKLVSETGQASFPSEEINMLWSMTNYNIELLKTSCLNFWILIKLIKKKIEDNPRRWHALPRHTMKKLKTNHSKLEIWCGKPFYHLE